MSTLRPIRPNDRAWQDTTPGDLAPLPDDATAPGRRAQPPLREVLRGLDARELEGETVFDQLFGSHQPADPRPTRR
jgi:hypothetical protein